MTVLDETKLRSQVERIAGSPEFARADRMVQFLRYAVDKTLSGNTAALRERQIGVAVFERPSDWDPKLDNIVRSEARRLRSKLEAYAARHDQDETVRITMPTGGYGVLFEELEPRLPPLQEESVPTKQAGIVTAPSTPRPAGAFFKSLAWSLLIAIVCVLSTRLGVLHYRSQLGVRADEYEIVPFSSEPGLQFSPAISPDGKTIAFVWNAGSDNFNIYSKTVDSQNLKQLTNDLHPSSHPAWSPDGKRLAFLRDTGSELPLHEAGTESLIVLDLEKHESRLIRRMQYSMNMWSSSNPLTGCQMLSWSSRGDQIVMTDSSREARGLISVSTATGDQRVLTKPDGEDQDCFARLSPDGSKIAFVRFISHAMGYLCIADFRDGRVRRLTEDVRDLRGLDWTYDGSKLIFASKDGGVYQLRMISDQGGESIPLPAATASASNPSVSPDGKFVAFVESHENWNIWRLPLKNEEAGTPQRFLASTGHNHSASFAPDGRTIAFVSDRSGNPEIWLCDSEGQHLRQLTHFGGPWLGTIRWSPDGNAIVFDARPNGHAAVYTMVLNGGKPELVENQSFEVRRPSWSRDGRYIYFDTTRGGVPEIWKRDLKTEHDQLVAPAGFLVGIESPDGKKLFYEENEQRHIWVSDPDGSNARQLSQVSPTPDMDWTLFGTSIYFASAVKTGGTDIMMFDLSTEKSKKLGHVNQTFALGTPSFVVSPDGKSLLYSVIDNSVSEIKLRHGVLPL